MNINHSKIPYNLSKWQRKQRKCNKSRKTKTHNKQKVEHQRRSGKSVKILNKQHCEVTLKNITYGIDHYIGDISNTETDCKCHECHIPFLLEQIPMTGSGHKPLLCPCCVLQHQYSLSTYTIITNTECIVCNKIYEYQQLILIDNECKICKESLAEYFTVPLRNVRAICIHCAENTDICIQGKKSKFCSLYKTHRKRACTGSMYNPIIRTDIINKPFEWKFKPEFAGYRVCFINQRGDINISCSILDEKYKIVWRANSQECHAKLCRNLDSKCWCLYHSYCVICNMKVERNYETLVRHRECRMCGKLYCFSNNSYFSSYPCGTRDYCKNCFIEHEKMEIIVLLRVIIGTHSLNDDVISVIFKYAHKYAWVCANYNQCQNVLISETSRFRDWNWYFYDIQNNFLDRNVMNHTSYIKGRYVRVFCHDCSNDIYECGFCANQDFEGVCWNHPKYKCSECKEESFCDDQKDHLCQGCGLYSCAQCAASKHQTCVECAHPICDKYGITDIVNKRRCQPCEVAKNSWVAHSSHLNPTACEYVPPSRAIAVPQFQNIGINWQLLPMQYPQIITFQQPLQLQLVPNALNCLGFRPFYNYNQNYLGGNNAYLNYQ